MAKLDLRFCDDIDFYSDGDVEDEIFSIVKSGIDITQDKKTYPFAVLYHLSPERENILNWYPFRDGAACLEIGAGCGAITGMLCKKNKSVVSVDISEKRCRINYERHKDNNNLTIIAGNFQNIKFENKFDYIVLNGVFEYALSFIHNTRKPYHKFLELTKGLLKPNGKILIAIENRLGLKYFNGAPEDHTENFFMGINGYIDNDTVRTFSKAELSKIIDESGFSSHKFYYPYPDYKFPSEIFTDETVNTMDYGKPYINFNPRSYGLFSEQMAAMEFKNEEIADKFSNSFLVEISNVEPETISYVKINSLRKKSFKIRTIIDSKAAAVRKEAFDKDAVEHIQTMAANSIKSAGKIKTLPLELGENFVECKLLNMPTLSQKLIEIVNNGDKEIFESTIKDFFDKYSEGSQYKDFYNSRFKAVFGETKINRKMDCKCGLNIDVIFDNIFPKDNGMFIAVDNEWVFDFDIPVKYVWWRCINEFYYKTPNAENLICQSDFLKQLGIDDEMKEIFRKWELHFTLEYVGDNYLLNYAVAVNNISLNELYDNKVKEKQIPTSCYLDFGNGFNESDKIFNTIILDDNGNFELRFNIPQGVKALRWDIVERMIVKCKISEMSSDSCNIVFKADNANENISGYDYFYTLDPHYSIENYGNNLKISGHMEILSRDYLGVKLDEYVCNNQKSKEQIANLLKSQEQYRMTLEQAHEKLHETESELSLYKAENKIKETKLNEISDILSIGYRYQRQMEEKLKRHVEDSIKLKNVMEEYRKTISMYESVSQSRAWRFIDKLWKIKQKIKNIFR